MRAEGGANPLVPLNVRYQVTTGLARFDEFQPGQRIHWRVLLRCFDQ